MGSATCLLFGSGATDESPGSWAPESGSEFAESRYVASARVLVVEDQPIVRSWLARVLQEAGHAVELAVNGAEALRMAHEAQVGYDLVITDVRMPEMDGWELGRRMALQWPELPVLYISGYDLERSAPGTASFLRKPFDPDLLLSRVAELLKGR